MAATDHIERVSAGDQLSAERDGEILDLLGREVTGPGVVADASGWHGYARSRRGLVWFELTEALTYPGTDQTPYTDNPTRVYHNPATDVYEAKVVTPWRIYAPGIPRDLATGYYRQLPAFPVGTRFAAGYNFQSSRWEMILGLKFDRCNALLKGALASGNGTTTVDNVVATRGVSPLDDPTDMAEELTVDNFFAWDGDDNARCKIEYNEDDDTWELYQVKCPA